MIGIINYDTCSNLNLVKSWLYGFSTKLRLFKGLSILTFCLYLESSCLAQKRNIFFDFLQDSIKSRIVNASAPSALQSFSLNNSILIDYFGETRFCILSGVLSGKKDTALALHSLVNGAGNLSIDAECPFALYSLFKKSNSNFIGASLNPRISALISNNQTFKSSMISYDMGLNLVARFNGDLGNISCKTILRSAFCSGNNQFIGSIYNFKSNNFVYSSFQIKVKSSPNIFSLTLPLYLYSLDDKFINKMPLYVGYSLCF